MQIRMIEILVVTSVAGLALAGLCTPNDFFESLVSSITLLLILISVPMVISRRAAERSFWIAFGVTASIYLFFFAPLGKRVDLSGALLPSQSLAWAYRQIHIEPSSDDTYDESLFGDDPPEESDAEDTLDDLFGSNSFSDEQDVPPPPDLAEPSEQESYENKLDSLFSEVDAVQSAKRLAYPMAPTRLVSTTTCGFSCGTFRSTVPYQGSSYYSFARIGHCAWSLMLAWCMGHIAKFTHRSAGVRVE